jgi:puromycin-sensitive aminopeptidase
MSKDTSTLIDQPETQSYRLPKTVIPARYEIRLSPDLDKASFDGEETIHVSVKSPAKAILLNSIDLEIIEAKAEDERGTMHSAELSFDIDNERVRLTFSQEIGRGEWKLHLKFKGALNEKLAGFYRSVYKDESGQQKYVGVTQFEATDARRAFPCFDEPDFKAVYKLTLTVDEKLSAVSNTAIQKETKVAGGKKEIVYNDTMKMSTYLVAFVIGDLVASAPQMAGSTPVRIWSVPSKKHLTKFAEGIAVHSLNYFAKYYGVPYPGDKLDLIAVPDFAFGAMENLGCVTFRETALLVDEKSASHAELERIADVVAHEIAHMWFGDLTTMSWWNGIWLNEAFATFAEMMAVHAWKPEWKRWETFGASRAAAQTVDGLAATRPIEFPVRNPEECQGMFDVLTYEKGASVLRMLEQYLEEPTFQKGISIYLKRHQFANTETSDLWAALAEASGQKVVELMDSWIFQKGHPMIAVELDASGKKLKLSQSRFFYLPDRAQEQLFQVPIMLRAQTAGGTVNKKILLKEKTTTVDFDQSVEWVIVNEGGHGFYRVNYSPALLNKLTAKLFEILSPIERFNLINDSWAMTLAGHMDLKSYIQLAMLFKEETNKNVWSVLTGSLIYLDRIVESGNRAAFESMVCRLVEPALSRIGFDAKKGEDDLAGQMRGMLISASGCQGNDSKTQEKAKQLFAKYKQDKAAVDPNIVTALVTILAHCGDKAQYDEFTREFKSAKTPQDEERYMYALAAFRQSDLLGETLKRCLNGEIRTQNAPYLMRTLMMNPNGRKLSWQFVKDNWTNINEKYPANILPRMCEGVTGLLDADLEKDAIEFFKAHPVPQGVKQIEQHLERLHIGVALKKRESTRLTEAFEC